MRSLKIQNIHSFNNNLKNSTIEIYINKKDKTLSEINYRQ